MSFVEFRPVPLPKLGGLFSFLKPLDVPSGYSPNLQNVRFLPRAVLSRSGLTSRMVKAATSFSGIAQFIDNLSNKTLVSLDANGNVDFQDPTTGNPDSLMVGAAKPGSFMAAKTAFGRIFMSFFNPDLSPAGLIRQWNGVRQLIAPQSLSAITVVDSATGDANWAAGAQNYSVQVLYECTDGSFLIGSSIANWNTAGGFQPTITGIPVAGVGFNVVARWVTFTLTGAPNGPLYRFNAFRIADNITTSLTAAGVSSTAAGMLAAGSIIDTLATNVVNPPCLPHIAPDQPSFAPTGADSANTGSVVVGTHMVWVAYETLFGYITALSPAGSWSAAGGKKALITKIATGPWYVVARRVLFSSAGGADSFYLSTFRIPNNTTTSVEVDFTDTTLLQGTNFDYLTKNFRIPPSIGVGTYGGRLTTWGALNALIGTNFTFDGGWDFTTGLPLGWTAGGSSAGGQKEQFYTYAGDAWRITGDGATATRGEILNASIQPLLAVNTPYSASFRIKADSSLAAGNLVVSFYSPSSGQEYPISTPFTQLAGQGWTEIVGQFTLGLASVPSDLALRVYANGTPTAGARIWIDQIYIYASNAKYETSVLRFSNPFDTETFDGTNGFQQVAKDNGEKITSAVQLRSFLYIMKERSMHVTYDDTINPPSLWVQRQIDSTIGTGSPRSLVSSDTFIAFSSRGGAYMFTGARPQKVSQEIQTDWNTLNWASAGATHTLLDPQAKVIWFFTPKGTDTVPKNSYILDYSEGVGQEDDPGPRKWGRDSWTNAITASLRFENSAVTANLFGANAGAQSIYLAGPKIYENLGASDDGAIIDSYYETAFVKAGEMGTDLFGGVTFYAEGNGTLLTTIIGIDDVIQQGLQNQTLSSNPGQQFEVYANEETERARVRFESDSPNANFIIKGIAVMSQQWAVQRVH